MPRAKKRGNAWHVYVCMRRDDGTFWYKHITGKTKKEAEQKATEFSSEQIKKEPSLTLKECCEQYIDDRASTLSPSTLRGYRVIIRNRLKGIGDKPVDEITQEMMQRHINQLASHLSPKTIDNTVRFLGTIFHIYKEETFRLSLPQRRKPPIYIPTDEDIEKLLSVAKGTDAELIITLSAFGSLRRGEISGLCCDCVYNNGIEIRRSHRQDEHGEWILDDTPKSFAGYRFVPLPEEVIRKLKQKCEGKRPTDTVFGMLPYQIYERFSVARRHAGLPPFKLHALRHYYATYLHSQGIPDHDIAKSGGWGDVGTLQRIYQHSTDSGVSAAQSLLFSHFDKLSESEK